MSSSNHAQLFTTQSTNNFSSASFYLDAPQNMSPPPPTYSRFKTITPPSLRRSGQFYGSPLRHYFTPGSPIDPPPYSASYTNLLPASLPADLSRESLGSIQLHRSSNAPTNRLSGIFAALGKRDQTPPIEVESGMEKQKRNWRPIVLWCILALMLVAIISASIVISLSPHWRNSQYSLVATTTEAAFSATFSSDSLTSVLSAPSLTSKSTSHLVSTPVPSSTLAS